MKRDIPYYAQTAEFSCGPASVLMVLKFFDPHFELDRSREFEAWRQCNMIGVRGADPFGLSVPLLDAGHEVHLWTERRQMVDPPLWKRRLLEHGFSPADADLAIFGMGENRKRALERGVTVGYGPVTVERIAAFCQEGFVPIALVHMGVVHQFDIPHWVVVADAGAQQVTFNDPYPPKGRKDLCVSREEFQRMLDDIGMRIGLSPSAIFIGKGRPSLAAPPARLNRR